MHQDHNGFQPGQFCHLQKRYYIFISFSKIQLECPSLPPSPDHLCVAPAGALDCHYESLSDSFGGDVNCCCGRCDIDMTCAPDSTTGSGFWQPMHSTLCPAEGCGSEGEYGVDGIVKDKCVEIIVKNSLHRKPHLAQPPWQLS